MAYWGQAISAGPDINNTLMDSAAARLAWENVEKAKELAGRSTPVEQALISALLLEQGRIREAERVYREDLRLHPNNGWALKGLAEYLHRSG